MNKKILHLLIFVMMACIGKLQAANLHAILVCDTHAINIESGVSADFKHMKKMLKSIGEETELNPIIHSFHGTKVDAGFVKKFKEMEVGSDDVILFYYSGHGKNLGFENDPWPIFDFEYEEEIVSLYAVALQLMEKHPRLLLAIADCCNVFDEQDEVMSDKGVPKSHQSQTQIRENFKKLFLHSSGTYIVTSALPGEASIGLDESDDDIKVPAGSFFTNALIAVLHEETAISEGEITWDMIFEKAAERAILYQISDPEDPQIYHHPQYVYIPA